MNTIATRQASTRRARPAAAGFRRGISMRWWLAAAFALIAAITAFAVAVVFSQRSLDAVRAGAEESATARTFAAA